MGSQQETPAALQVMAAAIQALGKNADKVTPVFITLDPERDTPGNLATFAARFHPRLLALTGERDAVAALATAYHIKVQRLVDASVPGGYVLEYPAFIFVLDQKGRFAGALEATGPVAELVGVVTNVLQ